MANEIIIDFDSFKSWNAFNRPMSKEEGEKLLTLIPSGCDGVKRKVTIAAQDCDYPSFEQVNPKLPHVVFNNTSKKDKGAVCSDPNLDNRGCLVCSFRDGHGHHAIVCHRLYSLLQR